MLTSIKSQAEYLMQGTRYGDEALQASMQNELHQRLQQAQADGRPLKVYCGFDPRTSDLHLGHTVVMRKLVQFQELGHAVTFVVGNYTSQIGDPSDKDKLRPVLTAEQVQKNARTYAEQAFKILDPEKTSIRYNADWLAQLSFSDLIKLASNFTLQQFMTRENFRLRWDKGDPIFVHEMFYALMQGYDAYTLEADVQVGGSDQLFNIVTASRKLMAFLGAKPNIAIIMGILPGTDGVVKMSKSLGNNIALLATPEDMYGKIMSIPDKALLPYFQLVSQAKPEEIQAVRTELKSGALHPRDAKMKLARELVCIYHGQTAATKAQDHFVRVFQKRSAPDNVAVHICAQGTKIVAILKDSRLSASKSEARRLIDQGAVRYNGQKIDNPDQAVSAPGMLQAGKRRFVRLLLR